MKDLGGMPYSVEELTQDLIEDDVKTMRKAGVYIFTASTSLSFCQISKHSQGVNYEYPWVICSLLRRT